MQAALKQDRRAWQQGPESLPPEVQQELLPQLAGLLRDLAELTSIQASTDRQRELTRGKRLANAKLKHRLKRCRLIAKKPPRLTISDPLVNGDGGRLVPQLNGVGAH